MQQGISHTATRLCPFCKAPVSGPLCQQCGQDPGAARKICKRCKGVTPSALKQCILCGAAQRSEMPGKIIIIVLMFLAAFIVSILVHMS
jgi:RNA polymerase subunit RPABC4/transcription elongation factor Spt4